MAESMFHFMELKGKADTGREMFPEGKAG